MPRRPNLQDLKKNFGRRFSLFTAFFILWLLADEFVKEGYFFDVADITMPGTHEFLIVLAFVVNAVFWVVTGWRRLRAGRQ